MKDLKTWIKYRRIPHRRTLTLILAGLALAAAPALSPAQVSLATLVGLASKNSITVRLAQSDLDKARAALSQNNDSFIPTIAFGSGLPAFPSVGFTGNLPTIWDASVTSLVFSMQQIRYIQAARAGVDSAPSSEIQRCLG